MRHLLQKSALFVAATAAILSFAATNTDAAPLTFSCPSTPTECNGATYALGITDFQQTSPGNFFYELTFGIDTNGYNGNSTDFIRAVSIKNVVSNFSNLALTGAPGGQSNWNLVLSGLNADGCKDQGEVAQCAEANATLNSGFGVPVNPAQQYFWVFTFNSTDGTPNSTGTIKYQYVRNTLDQHGDFKKVGDLGSFNITVQTPPPNGDVPEPASALLLAFGAVGFAARSLRRRLQL